MCRAARSEVEGWKTRTLHAEAHIAELKHRMREYRVQLGLPPMDPEEFSAGLAALPWHKPTADAETGDSVSHRPSSSSLQHIQVSLASKLCIMLHCSAPASGIPSSEASKRLAWHGRW